MEKFQAQTNGKWPNWIWLKVVDDFLLVYFFFVALDLMKMTVDKIMFHGSDLCVICYCRAMQLISYIICLFFSVVKKKYCTIAVKLQQNDWQLLMCTGKFLLFNLNRVVGRNNHNNRSILFDLSGQIYWFNWIDCVLSHCHHVFNSFCSNFINMFRWLNRCIWDSRFGFGETKKTDFFFSALHFFESLNIFFSFVRDLHKKSLI